jgi:RND family efflux transporter MFP subunit
VTSGPSPGKGKRMNLIKQTIYGFLAVIAAVGIWVFYVPSAAPFLERAGVYNVLGLEPPEVSSAGGQGRGFGGGAAQVVTAEAREGQSNDRVSAIGDGRAVRSVTVRSEATGMIRQLAVAPGSYVEQDALLAQLDDDAQRIALERARLLVVDASTDLDRLRQLGASGAVSEVQIRAAELALRTAELEVEQAQFELQQRRITAPIAGWTGILEVEQGDRISAQDTIAVIADRSSIEIDFRVPERFIGALSIGMAMEVTPLARPDTLLAGEIVALDNVVDRASRTLRVQGRLDNEDDNLRAGQAFSVVLSFPGDTLPSVDPLAIQWSGDGSYVWVAREGAAVRVPVTIRQRNSDSVLIEGDVTPGDAVIIEGLQSLRPGAAIEIVAGSSAQADGSGDAVARNDR